MSTVSLLCICIALVVFMYMSYKGVPCILVAPLLAIFILITSGMDVAEGMSKTYMGGVGGFETMRKSL